MQFQISAIKERIATATPEDIKTASEIIGIWAALLGSLAAGIFTVTEYLENKETEQIKSTLEILKTFNEDRFKAARLEIDRFQTETLPKFETILNSKRPQKETNREYLDFTNKAVIDYQLAGEVTDLLEFYEDVAICASNSICDRVTAEKFFKRRGKSFVVVFAPYICRERFRWRDPGYGEWLGPFFTGQPFDSICRQYGLGLQASAREAENQTKD